MDSIVWKLAADGSFVRSEMMDTVRSVASSGADIEKSFGRVDASHEKLLRSGHRVSKQITNVSRDLLSGASAGDVFAGSLEGIARSLNISLGALAVLGVSAVVVQKIYAAREAYHKLSEELKTVHEEASKSGDFKTLSAIEAQAKKAEEAVKKLTDAIEGRGGKKGVQSGLGQYWSDVSNNLFSSSLWGKGPVEEQGAKDRAMRQTGYADQDTLAAQAIAKRQQQSGLKQAALDGTPDSTIKAAQVLITLQEKAGSSLDEAAQSFREASIALSEIVKAANDKKAERAGMSLKELAGMTPDVVDNSVSYEKWKASQDAKRAMGLDAQGEAARQNFDPQRAHALFNEAGAAKDSIQNLKPSEKMAGDLKGALSVTEQELHEIAENTRKQFVNR